MTKASDELIVRPSAEGLAASVQAASRKGPPPVHLWNPPFCGDIDMRIRRDGVWFYQGTPIGRPGLVKLFSSILKREGDRYFLVTPVEKVGITVDDAPMLAVDFSVAGEGEAQTLTFTTLTEEPAPYILIRANLEALIDRKSFYRLIDLGTQSLHEGQSWFGLWSSGTFFPVIPAAELPD
jgi:uncharacterized protein